MRFSTRITFLVLLLIAGFSNLAFASTKRSLKILAFGDSLTAGYRLLKAQAYPAQLEKLLKQEGLEASVHNAGVSGDTSAQGLRRVDWVLKQGPYDMVLLALGANDGLRQLPLKNFESNLKKLVERFQKNGSKVVLMGMKLPTNLSAEYRQGFEEIYKRVARQTETPLLAFLLEGVATQDFLNLEDRIHPNAEGQKKVAQNVFKFIRPLLDKTP